MILVDDTRGEELQRARAEMRTLAELDDELLHLYQELKLEDCSLRREKIARAIRETQAELIVRRSNPKPWWVTDLQEG